MTLDRLTERYTEALDYWTMPVAEAARSMWDDMPQPDGSAPYDFCRAYIQSNYKDRGSSWSEAEHGEAYRAARKARGDVQQMGVQPV